MRQGYSYKINVGFDQYDDQVIGDIPTLKFVLHKMKFESIQGLQSKKTTLEK